jgi:polyisoprenoid-binding protein YceI
VAIRAGTHKLGPENGTLSVRTKRTGAAAKAGHDLLIHATRWQATVEVGESPAQVSIVLDVDATSLRVRDGTGGMQALGDDDKLNIQATIDDEVLHRNDITFRSTAVQAADDGSRLSGQGELTLVGKTCPIAFELTGDDDGALSGSAVVKQSDWGIKPYSTLFGALKVVDEVEVGIEATYGRVDPGYVAESEGSDPALGSRARRLRAPNVSPGVSSFLWALVFFLYLWLGMAAIGVSHTTSLPCAIAASFAIYVLIRKRGTGRLGPD